MSEVNWSSVDDYFNNLLTPSDPVLDEVLQRCTEAGLYMHQIAPNQGRFFQILVQVQVTRNILEIGTLGGYSAICFAKALPRGVGAKVISLESIPKHVEVARNNTKLAGVDDIVDIRLGYALDTLPKIKEEGSGPFDIIFIDADKQNYPDYLTWALNLSRPGTLIIADNVVRDGQIIISDSRSPSVQGLRRFTEMVAAEQRLMATAIQTVGSKGWDGFIIARVER